MSDSFDEFQPVNNEWDEFAVAPGSGPSNKDVARAVVPANPDHAAAAAKLAKKYNAPDEVLLRNLQDVQVQDAVNEYSKKLGAAPVLADYMRKSPFVAKQSHDDIDALTQVGQFFSDTAGSVKAGVFNASRGAAGVFRSGFEFVAPVLDVLEPVTEIGGNPLRRLAEGFDIQAQAAGATAKASAPKVDGILAGGFHSGIQSLTQNVLALPLAFAPGGQGAALSVMTASTGGNAYQDAREKGLSMSQALPYAASQASIEWATEKMPLLKLVGDVKAGTPVLQTLMRQVAAEVPGEQVATILQDMNEWAVLNPEKPFSSYLEERPSAAAQTLIATIVGVGGNVTVSKGIEAAITRATRTGENMQDAEANAQRLAAAMQAATASKLRERNPETFRQLVQHIAENTDGAPQSVYIDAQVLAQSGVDIATVLPGVVDQLDGALAANSFVEVPIAEALANLPGTPLEQVFLQNARSAPDALSLAEAEQAGAQATEYLKQEADRVLQQAQDQSAWQASSDTVRTTILDQLNQAGRFTPEVNEAYATLQMHFFSTMAARVGITPQEMYDRFALKVSSASKVQAGQVLNAGNKTGEISVEGYHFSKAARTTLIGDAYGTGLQGSNRDKFMEAQDPRLRKRIYFYADTGTGINPEAGVGGIGHKARLSNIYDSNADPLRLKTGRDQLAFESAVLDAGFSGYLDRMSGTQSGQVILLGDQSVQVEQLGPLGNTTGEKVPAPQRTEAQGRAGDMQDNVLAQGQDTLSQTATTTPTSLPAEIEVDGKMRPTTNSNGQPIAATEDGVRNFWAWFGDSKVVDADGKPLVVYHGTNAEFDAFDPTKVGSAYGQDDAGFFFTSSKDDAVKWADSAARIAKRKGQPSGKTKVLETYLSLNAPWSIKVDTSPETGMSPVAHFESGKGQFNRGPQYITQYALDSENDGVIIRGDKIDSENEAMFIAFRPTQIKSAIGNNGEFDPANPNILKQQARGTFNPQTLLISLNENANLSTFLHESGHFFLEVMADIASQPDAPADVAADMDKLLAWFGIKGDENVGDADAGGELAQQDAEAVSEALYKEMAADDQLVTAIETWMVDGAQPDAATNARLLNYMRRMPPVPKDSYLTFYRGQPRGVNPQSRGWASWTTNPDTTRFFTEGNSEVLERKGAQGISLERLALWRTRTTGELTDYGTQAEWLVLNESVFAQDGNLPTDNTRPVRRTPLETWRAMTLDQKRQYHERFAESFEAYLLEGKAPSQELQPLFRRFRSWLVSVYKSLKDFMQGRNLNMNDEVRQVFDRMLATDEQIAQAEDTAGMLPDFDATNEAIEKLQARSLRDLKWTIGARSKALKALQKEAANLRKAVEAEVRAEVEATPEMRAKAALDDLRKTNKRAPTDMEIATVADSFGYPTVDAMLQAIDAFGPKKDAIEGLTDRRMLENFGELATPEAIEEAANDAVHNEARARSLATELKAQAEALNPREDTGRTASNGRPITVNALAAAAKEFAENLVARRKVKDLKNAAWQHRAAEARAGKAWQDATAKGKTQEAVQAKRDQMLNNYAAKAMGEAQAEVKKILDFFARVTKGNNEKTVERGRDPDVVNAARAILAAYEIAPRLEKGALEYLAVLEKNDPAMYAALQPSIAGAVNNAKPVGEMSMEELRGLKDEIDAMWHLAKRSRQMEVDGNLLDIEDAASELQERMQEIGVPDTMPGDARAITNAEKRARWLQHAGSLLRRAEQWAEGMDGKFGGPFLRLVFQPVKEAANRYRADRVKYRKAYQALVDNVAPALRKGTIAAPELGYTFGEGHNGIGHAELLHAILHTGNESNKRKLLLGRKWATENADGTLDTSRWDAFTARMQNEGILAKEHYDFAQGVWDLLEQTKPLAQKTHRDVFGRYFDEVSAGSFDTPFGTYRGGYVPAQADPRIVQDADLRKLAEAENENMAYSFPSTNKGFTKGRVEYNRPLLLDLRTIGQHIDKVLLFAHMEPAVRDVNKLLSQKGVSYSLGRIDPTIYAGMLTPWLSRSARQIVETPILGDGGISRVLSAARSRAGMALMFANVSNSIQQLSGFSNAFAKLKADGLNSQMLRATAQFISSPKEMSRNVASASTFMNGRMENEIAAINDAMDAILLDPSLFERAQAWTQKHAYFLQMAFANTMELIIWTAGYNAALEKGMDERDAVRYADGLIRQTQGSTLPEDVSRIETGPAYGRIFTQFIGYFNMMANTNATGLKQISQDVGLKKGAGKALLVVTTGMLVPLWVAEAIAQAMRGGPDDEDDDGYLDDWLAAVFGMGTIKGTFAMAPFVGQIANVTLNKMNSNPADDRASLSPAVSLLEAGAGVPTLAYQAITDPEKINARNAVRDVASALSIATGIPLYALARPLGYLAGVADDKIEPTGPVDAVRGAVTGTPSEESRTR